MTHSRLLGVHVNGKDELIRDNWFAYFQFILCYLLSSQQYANTQGIH